MHNIVSHMEWDMVCLNDWCESSMGNVQILCTAILTDNIQLIDLNK